MTKAWDDGDTIGTLTANNAGGSQRMPDKKHFNAVIEEHDGKYTIRKLTPLECCRLQGFPDDYMDGAEGCDSAKYRMWGNGISLDCASWIFRRIQ